MPVQINSKFLLGVGWSQRSVSLREPVSWKSEMSGVKDKKGYLDKAHSSINSANALERVGKLVG